MLYFVREKEDVYLFCADNIADLGVQIERSIGFAPNIQEYEELGGWVFPIKVDRYFYDSDDPFVNENNLKKFSKEEIEKIWRKCDNV